MTENAAGGGLLGSLRQLLGGLVDVGRTRLALLANEVEEEKIRLVGALARGVLAFLCFAVGMLMLMAFLTLAFWENRLLVLGGGTVLFLGSSAYFFQRARQGLQRGSSLFKASLSELEADADSLRGSKNEFPSV